MPTGGHAAGLPAVRAATTSGASAWSAVPARAASSRLAPLAWSGRRHALGVRRLFMRAETTPKEFVMYNTLARDKQPFKPIADDGKTVKDIPISHAFDKLSEFSLGLEVPGRSLVGSTHQFHQFVSFWFQFQVR